MKIAKSEFAAEELAFLAAILGFFLIIFIGAFNFSAEARLFPLMLSTPAIILLILYIVRGLLPPMIAKSMAGEDLFTIGQKVSKDYTDFRQQTEATISSYRSHFIFGFTFLLILLAFLVGFYLSVLVLLVLYMFFVRSEISYRFGGALMLVLGILLLVYIFDRAFGYHFNEGILWTFPPF